MRAFKTFFVLLSILSPVSGFAKDLVLSSEQNVSVVKMLLEKSPALKIELAPDSEDANIIKGKGFSLASYLLNALVNSNVLAPEDSTVRVSGVAGVCSQEAISRCSFKIFNGLYYKQKDAFNDKVGEYVITIDFKTRRLKENDFSPLDNKIALQVEVQ